MPGRGRRHLGAEKLPTIALADVVERKRSRARDGVSRSAGARAAIVTSRRLARALAGRGSYARDVTKARLETFSDGVIAILITIMVLDLHTPAGTSWHALRHELPVLLAYVLSFVYLGIYWNNHHHMLAAVSQVSGGVLWANLHLLFWLSLVPFSTAWMSEHRFPSIPTATYGIVLLAAGIAYLILQMTLLRAEGERSHLRVALGSDRKGKLSALLYCLGIGLSFANRWLGVAVYVGVALLWLVPDRRVERYLTALGTEPTD
jgi:uncharacterized membrane protein